MKLLIKLFFLLVLISTPLTVEAEFYKFVDENGNTRFVDDLGQVPADQRKNAKKYKSLTKEEAAKTGTEPKKVVDELPETSEKKIVEDKNFDFDAERKRLEATKKEIDAEYEVLIKEKKRLADAKNRAKTEIETQEYQRDVVQFNKKTIQYLEKQKKFNSALEFYNKQVEYKNRSTKKAKND